MRRTRRGDRAEQTRRQPERQEPPAREGRAPYEKVLADIVSRDERDSQRSTAPLKAAPDAHIIDTSNMDIDEVVAKAREIIENYKESA